MIFIFKTTKHINIINIIISQLLKIQKKFLIIFKGTKYDLIIYDDIYPHPISGFRYEEFTYLLNHFKKSKILINPKSYNILKTPTSYHKQHKNELIQLNKQLANSIKNYRFIVNINCKVFYCIFLNNIYEFLPALEKFKIPFVFTLYPGGGFSLNDSESDNKLMKVIMSPMFKKVIVTQKITKSYLIEKKCNIDKIQFVFGCVVPQNSIVNTNNLIKKIYPIDKINLDICFCSAKYSNNGFDKGYDIFIELAHLISLNYEFVRFHIVGGFDETDINIEKIKDKVIFYGYQNFNNLGKIYNNVDIFVSPNRPFLLNKGSFDGFPLGTAVEASLNGVMLILSDELNQNTNLINGKDIMIVKPDVTEIYSIITNLINNPSLIRQIAENGKLKFANLYSNKNQMQPRIEVLSNIINNNNDTLVKKSFSANL